MVCTRKLVFSQGGSSNKSEIYDTGWFIAEVQKIYSFDTGFGDDDYVLLSWEAKALDESWCIDYRINQYGDDHQLNNATFNKDTHGIFRIVTPYSFNYYTLLSLVHGMPLYSRNTLVDVDVSNNVQKCYFRIIVLKLE